MRFKGQLKGVVTTPEGNLRAWTGLPVGFGLPIIFSRMSEVSLINKMNENMRQGDDPMAYGTASLANAWSVITYASPLVVALPLLAFKTTRMAALGIIGGGVIADTLISMFGLFKKEKTSTPSTTQTEGASVQILGR